MRLGFWRSDDPAPRVGATVPAPASPRPNATTAGELDLRTLGQALARKQLWIIVPTVLAALVSVVAVNLLTPRYKSEARILIDGRENIFLRPNGERSEERAALDPEAVTSQVQLVLSRDLARVIIAKNRLAERPEFDPVLQGVSPSKSMLALFGIGRDPLSLTPEERVLDSYFERLTSYAIDKSRVIVVEFQSHDPDLAVRVANSIADGYLVLQQNARQEQAKSASQWLSGEIDNLRKKVSEAESRAEDFRSRSSLFVGTNNTTLSNQQMGELNTQLNNARALKSDAESKAGLIREMLQTGKPIEATEVLNSELMRRLSEQRVTLRAQLAEQSSTLLDNHPRIKELKAQLADLDRQIRDEAGKISRSLDNDARIAGGRLDGLSASLDQLKKQATSSNGQDVQLRALEREAKAQRDLLESYLAKFREANTRENIDAAPADGRIISRAIVSNTPTYPKKLPIVLLSTFAMLLLSSGVIVTGELMRMTTPLGIAGETAARAQARSVLLADALPADPLLAEVKNERAPESPLQLTEIEKLAEILQGAGAARKITMLGTASNEEITLTAMRLAREMEDEARVVVVQLAPSSSAISSVSIDPGAPGLAELMQGEASFSQVITKDRFSRVHLVGAGRAGSDHSFLNSPRIALVIDALLRVYDHVLLDAGAAFDLTAELLTANAQAVVVPASSMGDEERALMRRQFDQAGFSNVMLLSGPAQPSDLFAPRGVAA